MRPLTTLRQLKRAASKARLPPVPEYQRPKIRGECCALPRPCPFVGCRYHLATHVSPRGGLRIMQDDLSAMEFTCALDAADEEGPMSPERIAELLSMRTKHVLKVQHEALLKLREAGL